MVHTYFLSKAVSFYAAVGLLLVWYDSYAGIESDGITGIHASERIVSCVVYNTAEHVRGADDFAGKRTDEERVSRE